jgi:hypothetical protein
MAEFIGTGRTGDVSAVFISSSGPSESELDQVQDPVHLAGCLQRREEIYRSLWDRRSLIAHLDIEYFNLDCAGDQYCNPIQTFRLQEQVVQTITKRLRRAGVVPLHVLSGRGHHLVWQIRQNSPAFRSLSRLGPMSRGLRAKYAQSLPPRNESIGAALGRAAAGIGLLLEHLALQVMRVHPFVDGIPITLTAVETRSRRMISEGISIDLSEYGDPLHTRAVRIPFSVYYKPLQQKNWPRQRIPQPGSANLPRTGLKRSSRRNSGRHARPFRVAGCGGLHVLSHTGSVGGYVAAHQGVSGLTARPIPSLVLFTGTRFSGMVGENL